MYCPPMEDWIYYEDHEMGADESLEMAPAAGCYGTREPGLFERIMRIDVRIRICICIYGII